MTDLDEGIALLRSKLNGTYYGFSKGHNPQEVRTMQLPGKRPLSVPIDAMRRELQLPAYADEATIQAAMRCAPPRKSIRAAALPAPAVAPAARPLLDVAARARAASDSELRALAGSALSGTDRQAVAEEISHRAFVSSNFPDAARAAGYEIKAPDLTARSGDIRKDVGYA